MNIFTKIKNWLIKKLGGYTEKEFTDISAACGGLKKLYGMSENHLRIAENAIEYWRDKYNTEHENYLALLNCHNATAEAMQANSMGVAGAIDTIKAYCKSKGSCDECALYNKNGGCKVHEIPCYWMEGNT